MKKKTYELSFLSKGGPYSHVVEAGDLYFLSGMLPVDHETGVEIKDDIKKATELCLRNIQRALEHVGSNMGNVVKVTVFLQDMAYFNDMNTVYKTFFPEEPPARTCVAVKAVPGNFPLEIEVIAFK
jgi:2-iminobutanoate/2-iminopropanoate deaminase